VSVKPEVVVLGAGGAMGLAMSRKIVRAGFPLCAWNRTREKADPLAREGARVVDSPAEAAQVAMGARIVMTMLSDTDAVLEVMVGEDGFLRGPEQDGLIWAQMTTIGVPGTEHCAELAQRHGLTFIDAPVIGSRGPAVRGELIVLASGPRHTRDAVQPLFDAVGKETIWVGPAARWLKRCPVQARENWPRCSLPMRPACPMAPQTGATPTTDLSGEGCLWGASDVSAACTISTGTRL
jgi:3-hydroxyisobutyrate dehydrogenase